MTIVITWCPYIFVVERKICVAPSNSRFTSREFSLIIIFSALGGAASVPIGHLGNLLKTILGIPFGSSQALSGLHMLLIVLGAVLLRKRGSGTMTGVLRCLVEVFLLSYHGVFVLLISSVEGVIVDVVLTVLRRVDAPSICLAGGLSSASNFVAQFILVPHFPQGCPHLHVFDLVHLRLNVRGLSG